VCTRLYVVPRNVPTLVHDRASDLGSRRGIALRVRPDILRGPHESYNSAQHEPDHRENDKTELRARFS
jgi:hypothetical protein